jgi:hypothetical protein
VTGFDLDKPGNGSMPRKYGWPRQQSMQKSNANEDARIMAAANMIVNPIMAAPMAIVPAL